MVGFDKRAMARPLAIETEAAAVVSDLHDPAIERLVASGRIVGLADRQWTGIFVSRMQRVLREQVQNIREQQFLMLLFVIAAEFDQLGDGRRKIVLHQRSHRAIDMVAIRSKPYQERDA